LAEVVKLDCLGAGQTAFQVVLGSRKATERLAFDYTFDPEASKPGSPFSDDRMVSRAKGRQQRTKQLPGGARSEHQKGPDQVDKRN
jgi:hypothetical protein